MIKKQLKTSREQRNTQNRNSLHEAIRRSMRQSFKAADYNQPPPPPARKTVHVARPAQLNSTTFIRNKAKVYLRSNVYCDLGCNYELTKKCKRVHC